MKISHDQAATIARLARLHLDEKTLTLFASQFESILGYMDTLNELDTSGVEPLYSPIPPTPVFREDVAERSRSREDILRNAPEEDGRFFIVPRIV